MTTLKFQVAPRVGPAVPRGARVAAALAAALLAALQQIGDAWRRRRKGAPTLSPAEEAAAVREMAWRIRDSDPGFAADLFAAADRHERLYGG